MILWYTIFAGMVQILTVIVTIGIMTLSTVVLCQRVFGTSVKEFMDFQTTFGTIVGFTFGDFEPYEAMKIKSDMASWILWPYMIVVVLIVLNLFIVRPHDAPRTQTPQKHACTHHTHVCTAGCSYGKLRENQGGREGQEAAVLIKERGGARVEGRSRVLSTCSQ